MVSSLFSRACAPLALPSVLLPAICFAPVAASARPVQLKLDESAKVLREELKETRTPGAALAMVEGDRLIFARGFGTANV